MTYAYDPSTDLGLPVVDRRTLHEAIIAYHENARRHQGDPKVREMRNGIMRRALALGLSGELPHDWMVL